MQNYQLLLVLNLLAYAAQRGLPVNQLCQLSGFSSGDITQPTPISLTTKQTDDVWRNVISLSHDPLFGLHLGESLQVAALGVVGGLIQTSRSIGEALTQAVALVPLLTDLLTLTVSYTDQTFTVQFVPNSHRQQEAADVCRQQVDFFMAFLLHEVDGLVLQRMEPRLVHYPETADQIVELSRVLRGPIVQQGTKYELIFDSSIWHEPILTRNYAVQELLLKQVQVMDTNFTSVHSSREQVRQYLQANAYLGIPSLEAIAANFNTSSRSIQRKLQQEGVTYQAMVDSVRKTVALQYMAAGSYSVKEIAYLLGYNELSAFSRAFKRWTGSSPTGK